MDLAIGGIFLPGNPVGNTPSVTAISKTNKMDLLLVESWFQVLGGNMYIVVVYTTRDQSALANRKPLEKGNRQSKTSRVGPPVGGGGRRPNPIQYFHWMIGGSVK